jgi:hypothetical protein
VQVLQGRFKESLCQFDEVDVDVVNKENFVNVKNMIDYILKSRGCFRDGLLGEVKKISFRCCRTFFNNLSVTDFSPYP